MVLGSSLKCGAVKLDLQSRFRNHFFSLWVLTSNFNLFFIVDYWSFFLLIASRKCLRLSKTRTVGQKRRKLTWLSFLCLLLKCSIEYVLDMIRYNIKNSNSIERSCSVFVIVFLKIIKCALGLVFAWHVTYTGERLTEWLLFNVCMHTSGVHRLCNDSKLAFTIVMHDYIVLAALVQVSKNHYWN